MFYVGNKLHVDQIRMSSWHGTLSSGRALPASLSDFLLYCECSKKLILLCALLIKITFSFNSQKICRTEFHF